MKNVNELKEKYPELLSKCIDYSPPKMWEFYVEILLDYLNRLNKRKNLNIKVVQVKEKFGSLRVYLRDSTEEADVYASIIESICSETCIVCGSHNKVRKTGDWIAPYCERHAEEVEKQD